MSRTADNLRTLERRRDQLAEWLTTGQRPNQEGYIRSELAALTWAIRLVRNAREAGALPFLAAYSELEQHIIEGAREGLTLDEIGARAGVGSTTMRRHASRMCGLYGCTPDELPERLAARVRVA